MLQAMQAEEGESPVQRKPIESKGNAAIQLYQSLEEIGWGTILFNPSRTMKVGQTNRIECRITRDEMNKALTEGLKGTGDPNIEKTQVSWNMGATLGGANFTIRSLSQTEQIIPAKGITEWSWGVKPEKSGEHDLQLQVYMKLIVGDNFEAAKSLPVIDETINVSVNPVYTSQVFVVKNWKTILTACVIPLLIWFGKNYVELKPEEDKKTKQEQVAPTKGQE